LGVESSSELESEAAAIAQRFGLPLEVREVGTGSLEAELEELLGAAVVGHRGAFGEFAEGPRG